jgi:hypothetical protein
VVDQVDDVEHVRAVALAVHHQEVRQREHGVAEDVGPDLGELRLDRGGLDDRSSEGREGARGVLGGGIADPADDAREGRDLLQESPRRDPLGCVGDVHVLARP